MDPAAAAVICILLLLFLLPLYLLLLTRYKTYSKRLPPGSLGLPIIGQSLTIAQAMRRNTGEKWLQDWIAKYGPISKMNLFGTPTVLIHGQAANKFVYTCDSNTLANKQPTPIRRLLGERNIFELSGHDHKRVRGALVSFLKPEVLKLYVEKMDREVRKHLDKHWHGKEKVLAMPLMKTLTFTVISSILIGIEEGERRNALLELFGQVMEGMLAIPINLPFTRFNRSLQANAKIRSMIMDLIREKRKALEQHIAFPQQDLLTCLISLRDEDNSALLSDDEIVDNLIVIMIAGYDTTSILLSCLIKLLADDPSIRAKIIQEQEEIAKVKASSGEFLAWEDLSRMRYTWRVAMECLRVTPPVFFSFRKVIQDFEYQGYLIPKGWQVSWPTFKTHMDDGIFPNPSEFDPTRFEQQKIPAYSFIAFGGGPRMCPGNEFAKIETLVAVHYLVSRFTWKICNKDVPLSRDPLPTFKDGLEIQIQPKIITEKPN